MKKLWIIGVMVALTAGLLVLPAAAQDASQAQGKAAQLFKQADTNGDGSVTLDELKTVLPGMTQERFSTLDRNGDGALTREDLRSSGARAGAGAVGARGAGQMLARLKQADTNGDQRITLEEAKAAFPQVTQDRFNRFDRNGDGVISREDLPSGGAGGARGGAQLLERLKQADTNGDGKVSFEEAKAAFPRATEEVFKRFDRNGDGFLSPEDRNQ